VLNHHLANRTAANRTGATGAAVAAERYLTERVRTAGPAELTGMLLDAALSSIKLGQISLKAGNREEAFKRFTKAQDIVTELRLTINADAGELARNLEGIYTWVFRHLVTATVSSDLLTAARASDEAARTLEPITVAWAEAFGTSGHR
jgi:flagellar secretion chaperone FliS